MAGNVVDNHGGLRSSVVHGREGMVSFLSGRVPNLQLYGVALHLHGLREKGRYTCVSKGMVPPMVDS